MENVKKMIEANFKEIYDLDYDNIYLIGGALRECISKNTHEITSKDLDFIILDKDDSKIKELVNNNNLNYTINSFGGYKIKKENKTIDIWNNIDLYSAIQYNLDGLFYNVKYDLLIPVGYVDGINKKTLIELNSSNVHPDPKRREDRLTSLKKLIE